MRRFLSILFGDDTRRGRGRRVHGRSGGRRRADGRDRPAGRRRAADVERDRIRASSPGISGLSPWVAAELLARAERTATESVAWQGLTHTLKESLAPAERIEILEMLWEVAYADGPLHDYEASLLRRVAGLLYVSDRDNGEARLRVMAKLGIAR